jgi:hypothetical protein
MIPRTNSHTIHIQLLTITRITFHPEAAHYVLEPIHRGPARAA